MHGLHATNAPNNDSCTVCHTRFRLDDSIGTLEGRVVHSRCLPKPARVTRRRAGRRGVAAHG
jgi:hypothetical protein